MNYSETFRKLRSQVGHESNDTSEYANCLDNLPGSTFGVRSRLPEAFELVSGVTHRESRPIRPHFPLRPLGMIFQSARMMCFLMSRFMVG